MISSVRSLKVNRSIGKIILLSLCLPVGRLRYPFLFPSKVNCTSPITCWRCGDTLAVDGVFSPKLVFSRKEAMSWFVGVYGSSRFSEAMSACEIKVPCGKCFNCQMQKRKDWSVRLAHEASQFDNCCFITLTYKPECVPVTNSVPFDSEFKYFDRGALLPHRDDLFDVDSSYQSLNVKDVQDFLKRLRHHLSWIPKNGLVNGRSWARNLGCYFDHLDSNIRYFCVGEYGGQRHRPHYHILIFGWRPSDLVFFKMHNGQPVYRSPQLEKVWTNGFSTVCDVNPFVAKYCARYVTKKYVRMNSTWIGKDFVLPEFTLQSTRDGGIGSTWFDKYGSDACKVGLCSLRVGDRIQRVSIPRYYWNRLRKKKVELWLNLREERIQWLEDHPPTDDDMFDRFRQEEFYTYRFEEELRGEFFGSSDNPKQE